jgi:RimJ/RimL family protein N-acetyltransferase
MLSCMTIFGCQVNKERNQEKMPFPLQSKRLLLRHFSDENLDDFLAYRSDPLVARYQGWGIPYESHAGRTFIDEVKNSLPGVPGKWFQAIIELKSLSVMIGDCAFHVMENDRRQAYIGITLARPFWGKGYGDEASRCLLDYLFNELNLHRVVAECDVNNTSSYRLLDRLGFRREAHLLENIWFKDAWGSEFHYAMLDREWKKK